MEQPLCSRQAAANAAPPTQGHSMPGAAAARCMHNHSTPSAPHREAAALQRVQQREDGGQVGTGDVEQDFVGLFREGVGCERRK